MEEKEYIEILERQVKELTDYANALTGYIKELTKPDKWIPVEYQLPELNKWVFCKTKNDVPLVAAYDGKGWKDQGRNVRKIIGWIPIPIAEKEVEHYDYERKTRITWKN